MEQVVNQFYEKAWSEPDIALLDTLIHPDFHPKDMLMEESGPALIAREITYFRSIFPDLQYRILDTVTDQNRVWVHFHGSGTQKGAGWGFPATGESMEYSGVAIFTIENGLITDIWRSSSLHSIFESLGHLPPFWELASKLG